MTRSLIAGTNYTWTNAWQGLRAARWAPPKLRRKRGGKRKCQGALKPQSPRRLPELNHLRSSLTGIDRHARYDLVPAAPPPTPPPPPHLSEVQRIFLYLVFSWIAWLLWYWTNLLFSLSLTHNKYIIYYMYTPTRSTDSLFALAVFLDVRHRSLDDPPTSNYFDRSCLQTTSLKRMFWAFVWYAQLSERIWIRELRMRISKVCFSSALAVYFPPFEPSFFAEIMSFRLSVNMIFDGSIKSFRLICPSL